ncbi:MAG: MoaD/ThiS family protein [Anaerolineales bacterium]|jgi:molybdopterin converting factor small subunit|nr:MoaD/ThiS family protein [Chloroflexota bacterium]MBK6645602.1 MoaD/ThiS family protein [Anaerolineales bacterium]
MMIRVKMIANYRDALPAGHKHGVIELDVPDGATVFDAVSRFDIPLNDESVIVLNGLTVDLNTPLQEGDTVTAFSAIAGG